VTTEHWLEICRAMRDRVAAAVSNVPRARRADELGRGAGGDLTVAIDRAAEEAALAVLHRVAAAGEGFTVVSEEAGERSYAGGGRWRVVIDPVDGSLNAKRGLPIYALSVAVADGPAMADVALGYVYDLGNGEEWIARRGGGASVDGVPVGGTRPLERLQLVALEATRPEHLAPAAAAMAGVAERIRVLGSLALALCHLADGRVDAVASLRPRGVRSIDIAAGQLMVREAGGAVALPDAPGPFGDAPLDLEGRSRIVAARDDRSVAHVAALLGIGADAGAGAAGDRG
jgi:myo-inositol-1(or 4)-monophosphatase